MAKTRQIPPVDFTYSDHGSISLLRPITDMARTWLQEHVSGEHQYYCGALIIEWRYVNDVIVGIIDDGLRVGNTANGFH